MAYIEIMTLDELNDYTPGELQVMLAAAYRQVSAYSTRHSIERLRALVTIQNINMALAAVAARPRWQCVSAPRF